MWPQFIRPVTTQALIRTWFKDLATTNQHRKNCVPKDLFWLLIRMEGLR